MRVARTRALAKVNLWLKVGDKDASGYHEIGTIFHRIDLADEVVVRAGGEASVRSIDCAGPRLPSGGIGLPEKNLAWRAAVAYGERTGWPRGFAIELTKNIPVGGGLGGGSADAAAVLRALDAIAARPVGSSKLQEIAESLGSDIPFLASEHVAAVAGGRGEQLMPFEPLPAREVLLVVPNFAVATADAYRWLDEARTEPFHGTLTDLVSLKMLRQWDLMAEFSENDFEPVVEARHPELARHRARLRESGAQVARLTGSGSTVFGVFEGRPPSARDLGVDALVLPTRTSSRVVQVEVLE